MHKLLGGLCAALLFLAGLPQIGHTAEPVPLKTAWLGEHEAFAAWYAKQKGWDLEEGFRLKMLSYDSGKQLMAGMNTAQANKLGIARTFQNIRLFDNMSVEDNVRIGLHNQVRYGMLSGIFRMPGYWRG